jgi:hypothetical protein
MKKLISLLLEIMFIIAIFSGCAADNTGNKKTQQRNCSSGKTAAPE